MILAGRLDGFLNGRPLIIVAEKDGVTIVPGSVGSLLTLFRMRRSWRFVAGPLGVVLDRAKFQLNLRLGWFGRVELFPSPSLLGRLILPGTSSKVVP